MGGCTNLAQAWHEGLPGAQCAFSRDPQSQGTASLLQSGAYVIYLLIHWRTASRLRKAIPKVTGGMPFRLPPPPRAPQRLHGLVVSKHATVPILKHWLYLQCGVEKPPHTLEAAAGQSVLLQPAHGILEVFVIHVDVGLCLGKSPNDKNCQPVRWGRRCRRRRRRGSSLSHQAHDTKHPPHPPANSFLTKCSPRGPSSRSRCRNHRHVCRAADAGTLWETCGETQH